MAERISVGTRVYIEGETLKEERSLRNSFGAHRVVEVSGDILTLKPEFSAGSLLPVIIEKKLVWRAMEQGTRPKQIS